MKLLSSLILFLFFSTYSLCQENKLATLNSVDWCINSIDSNTEIISFDLPVFKICNSMFTLLDKKVSNCFLRDNNIFCSYEISPDKGQNTFKIIVNINFPIERNEDLNGVFFVNNIPIFMKAFSNVELDVLFNKTSDSIQVSRKKDKIESISCVNYETVYYEELIIYNNQVFSFRIENCHFPSEENRKKKKMFFFQNKKN
jgi:hypothetical protein